ncbi:MAG: hypothetical protein GY927_10770 [bacterium]|nr:hypothetical protein [bacterium]
MPIAYDMPLYRPPSEGRNLIVQASKKWCEVVKLLNGNSSLEEIAAASSKAAEYDLKNASSDTIFQ